MTRCHLLKEHKYSKCGYFNNSYLAGKDGWRVEWGFISYSTRVIIVRGTRVLFTGYYSPTTSRQISWWLNEYGHRLNGLTTNTLKRMAINGLAYNFETGELSPLTDYELKEIRQIRNNAFNYGYGW